MHFLYFLEDVGFSEPVKTLWILERFVVIDSFLEVPKEHRAPAVFLPPPLVVHTDLSASTLFFFWNSCDPGFPGNRTWAQRVYQANFIFLATALSEEASLISFTFLPYPSTDGDFDGSTTPSFSLSFFVYDGTPKLYESSPSTLPLTLALKKLGFYDAIES